MEAYMYVPGVAIGENAKPPMLLPSSILPFCLTANSSITTLIASLATVNLRRNNCSLMFCLLEPPSGLHKMPQMELKVGQLVYLLIKREVTSGNPYAEVTLTRHPVKLLALPVMARFTKRLKGLNPEYFSLGIAAELLRILGPRLEIY